MAPTEEEGPPASERHVAGTTEMRIQMNTSEVLNRAADVLERDGWHQGDYGSAAEGYCAMGAIRVALYGSLKVTDSAFTRPLIALTNHIETNDVPLVPDWNDAFGRTASEVVEAFRACALIEAAKENADVREQVTA